jgi:voltage-gated potassium channel Kch
MASAVLCRSSVYGVSWIVVQVVFAPGQIDRHRIIGAIVLYLNFALLFEVLFRLIAELSPGAFAGLPSVTEHIRYMADLMYLSMTTLTTVGYGDITPVHPIARSLANMEGLVGQLYPAIILARVMTLYSPSR